jgi:hypothetical protein
MSESLAVSASTAWVALSALKRVIDAVWLAASSLLGSIGGCPPFGEAKVTCSPASSKT